MPTSARVPSNRDRACVDVGVRAPCFMEGIQASWARKTRLYCRRVFAMLIALWCHGKRAALARLLQRIVSRLAVCIERQCDRRTGAAIGWRKRQRRVTTAGHVRVSAFLSDTTERRMIIGVIIRRHRVTIIRSDGLA